MTTEFISQKLSEIKKTREQLIANLNEIKKTHEQLIANLNALAGAEQAYQEMLAELEKTDELDEKGGNR